MSLEKRKKYSKKTRWSAASKQTAATLRINVPFNHERLRLNTSCEPVPLALSI